MSDQFVGEIRIVGFNFPPVGWAYCNGQLMPLSQNTALFSLLGTFYGGDGKSTFALPDLQGNAPISQGQGPGLSDRFLGEQSGNAQVTLLTSEIPMHNHPVGVLSDPGDLKSPPLRTLARSTGGSAYSPAAAGTLISMNPQSVGPAGSSLPHNNMQPYLTLNFVIALQGIFPARQ
jgi:microcystin-dependent protein